MNITVFKIIFFVTLISICPFSAFAQTSGDYKAPPAEVAAAVMGGQPYYVGMTKAELYKIYPASAQKSYYKEGNQEWVLFDDISTSDDVRDIIVFYLVDGVVSGWKKKELEKTPEEIYQTVLDRRKKYGGADLSGGSGGSSNTKSRRPIYQPPKLFYDHY